jgi:hypothetical protein
MLRVKSVVVNASELKRLRGLGCGSGRCFLFTFKLFLLHEIDNKPKKAWGENRCKAGFFDAHSLFAVFFFKSCLGALF